MIRSIFIAAPSIDFDVLLKTCDEVLGRTVTQGVDNTVKKLSEVERYLSILASIKDVDAAVGLPPNLLTHVSFSILTVTSRLDMMDVLESCSGMGFTQAETKARDILVAVITGTVQQWRDAIVTGSNHSEPVIREGFNQIHDLFVQAGLGQIWTQYEQQSSEDGTYKLIEYKP